MRFEEFIETPESAICLDQFLRLADERFDPVDIESVWCMRYPLMCLAANQEWIFATMAERLRERMDSPWAREQPSYFVLHLAKTFALRANIWMPERVPNAGAILENAAFSYDYPHDHNFDILTATCFGPGYETDVYEYESMPKDAGVGSLIDVKSCGRKLLSPRTVFLYEACKDVHTQLPVNDITITLNFLPFRKEDHAKPQFIFEHIDETTLKIIGMPLSPEGREMSAVRMLAKLASVGKGDIIGLQSVAAGAANRRVADYAATNLASLECGSARVHEKVLAEIDGANVAFKYHEVAALSRSKMV